MTPEQEVEEALRPCYHFFEHITYSNVVTGETKCGQFIAIGPENQDVTLPVCQVCREILLTP